ncbi:MAG TPA: GNVR domain-containing protein, partial [Flavisolibacter sp.]|nr:GNVR domain-containing protein [Flavisolibacter sp.]
MDQWVSTPFGVARFSNNPNLKTETVKPLYFSLFTPEKVLGDIAKNLSVTSAAKLSTVINLTLKDEVPERGKDILSSLIQDYNRAAIKDKNLLAANTLSFVEGRIKYVMKDLDSVENQLQRFKAEKGVVDLSEQGKLYLQNVGDNDRKMTEINMELAMLQEVEKYVRAKNNEIGIVPSIAGIRDPLLSQLLQRLYESQMQYERLQKTIPGGNPTMFSLKNEIDNMRPTILENIQNQRVSLQASKDNLSANTGMFASILQNIPKKEKQLLDISRQQAIKNDAYAFLLQKREETAFAYAAAVADSRTIEQANASLGPVSPKRNLVFEVAFAAALLLGIAIVNGRELLSNKILFRSDIENLTNLPIVAEIIKVKGKQPLMVNNTRPPAFIEQFRQLRAALGLNGKPQHKKILVASSIAGEGKSFIS